MTNLDLSTPFDGMTKPTKTLVALLLDKSYSMVGAKAATIDAYNEYVNGLKSSDILFTFVQFCSKGTVKQLVRQPIANVPLLDGANYRPEEGGATPLRDAVHAVIRGMETQEQELKVRGETIKVVIAIQTDGQENASTLVQGPALKSMIEEKTRGGWQFNFLGAGLEAHAYAQGAALGISVHNTVQYDSKDIEKTRSVFRSTASNTAMYASGAAAGTAYTDLQKWSAGDENKTIKSVVTGRTAAANPPISQPPSSN